VEDSKAIDAEVDAVLVFGKLLNATGPVVVVGVAAVVAGAVVDVPALALVPALSPVAEPPPQAARNVADKRAAPIERVKGVSWLSSIRNYLKRKTETVSPCIRS
jgi:hypothetical protein